MSTGFGAVVTEATGDWKPVVVSLLVALVSECVKYVRKKNKELDQQTGKTITDMFKAFKRK